jgi:hypothetical protein
MAEAANHLLGAPGWFGDDCIMLACRFALVPGLGEVHSEVAVPCLFIMAKTLANLNVGAPKAVKMLVL